MIGSIDELNLERSNRGEPPIRLSIGLHYGQVVLGDIGLNRLEFAVIGTAVNAASRLETLTREYGCAMVASDDLVQRARAEAGSSSADFALLVEQPPRTHSRPRAAGRYLDPRKHRTLMHRPRPTGRRDAPIQTKP